MARQKQNEWQVYFEPGYTCEALPRKRRPGKERPVGKAFVWNGAEWQVPAVYTCAQGLVADLVMRVPAGRIQDFAERWGLRPDSGAKDFTREERMRLDNEDPFTLDFTPTLLLNGRPLTCSNSLGYAWDPLPGCHDPKDLPLLEHYGLDQAEGWAVWRCHFPWTTMRKPPIRSLAVRLEADSILLPGPHITAQGAGGSFPFTDLDGAAHTLTVQEYKPETLPENNNFQREGFVWPRQCLTLGYTVEPPLPRSAFRLMDCSEGDRPRRTEQAQAPSVLAAACAAVAFAAAPQDGAQPQLCYDVSSLYFELPDTIEWLMAFQQLPCEAAQIKLF